MKTLLETFFLQNWQRKAVALFLGVLVWLIVNHSLTTTKVISNVPVRIINLPQGKTIEGMQGNGLLNKKLNLTLIGNADTLNSLTASDLEIVIDATGKSDGWGASISKKNLISLNPEIDITKRISKVYHHTLVLRMTNLVTDTIPIVVTHPIGEAPRGYQFLDVWPYKLSLTVSGPEDIIKRLKNKEQKITFNLNDISKAQLDAIAAEQASNNPSDVVSFFVPDQWKQINIPLLSDSPLELDETPENRLRIDFTRTHLLSLDSTIVVSLFYPPEYESVYNPSSLTLAPSSFLGESHGIFYVKPMLYAYGTDRLFVQIIKNRIQLTITVAPPTQKHSLDWSILFVNPLELEDQYVTTLMSNAQDDDTRLMNPKTREQYLRNRFRSYMTRFRLVLPNDAPLDLIAQISGNKVLVEEVTYSEMPGKGF